MLAAGVVLSQNEAARAVAAAYTGEWARVVSTLIRITGDWTLAEDCAADAFEKALARWERDGVPDNPGAWLTTVAKNRALDRLRRAANESRKLEQVAAMTELEQDVPQPGDDRLRLIFTCCHPALSLEARVALTLRTVAGLTTPEIAAAFLVPESTMAQRIVRAMKRIANAGIPYRVPADDALPERLGGVLAVLYLLYTEGYARLSRVDLAEEAIRLTRALRELMPEEPEVLGLLSLQLLTHSRRAARSQNGRTFSLDEQDRSLWNEELITEGVSLLRPGRVGPYQVQAAIAAVHARRDGDVTGLVALYDSLAQLVPGQVVAFNRAVAVGLEYGFEQGLEALSLLTQPAHYLVPAARADFLRRLGHNHEAKLQYEVALGAARSDDEKIFLAKRLAEVEAGAER